MALVPAATAMQGSMMQQRAAAGSGRRAVAFAPARVAVNSRQRCVQVLAKKGKGKGMLRQSAGVAGTPGVPGLGGTAQMSMPRPETPAVDPENPEFVIFFRARGFSVGKVTMNDWQEWTPLVISKGNQVGNYLVGAMQNEWGRKLYQRFLIQTIGRGLYAERDKIEANIRQNVPYLAGVPSKNFQYAFKIRDKSKPEEWKKAERLTPIPPAEELQLTAVDNIKKFFSAESLGKMFQQS